MILGIDPGLSGALVILDKGIPVEWTLMPTYQVGKNNRVNCAELADWLRKATYWLEIKTAKIELVHAMPGQGVTSMFSFGHSVGSVMGVLAALGISTVQVPPRTWKASAGLIGTEKDAARSKAIELWPQWRDLDKKGKGQALADAALIGRFG